MRVLLKTKFFEGEELENNLVKVAHNMGIPVIIKDSHSMGEVRIINGEIEFNKYNAYFEFENEKEMLDFFNSKK